MDTSQIPEVIVTGASDFTYMIVKILFWVESNP